MTGTASGLLKPAPVVPTDSVWSPLILERNLLKQKVKKIVVAALVVLIAVALLLLSKILSRSLWPRLGSGMSPLIFYALRCVSLKQNKLEKTRRSQNEILEWLEIRVSC